jgi:hypothetical protein
MDERTLHKQSLTTMDGGMKGFDASPEHFRGLGHVRHIPGRLGEVRRKLRMQGQHKSHSMGIPASLIFLAVPPEPSNLTPL